MGGGWGQEEVRGRGQAPVVNGSKTLREGVHSVVVLKKIIIIIQKILLRIFKTVPSKI